jgi:hypothetical protein
MKTLAEMAEEYAQKKWDDYQEHLRIGRHKLHVYSFLCLGFQAGAKAALNHGAVKEMRVALQEVIGAHMRAYGDLKRGGGTSGPARLAERAIAAFDALMKEVGE